MARIFDLDMNPDRRTLRQFGGFALAGFGLLAALAWFEAGIFAFGLGAARVPLTVGLAALGGLAGLFSLLQPAANRWLYVGLAVITFPIGFVLSYVILGLLFYAIIAPIGLLLRLFGKDPLDRRLLPEVPTYWVEARAQRPKESYFRQF